MIATATIPARFGEQWLRQHQIGYGDFEEDDKAAIREFALLWIIFELQALFGDSRVDAMIGFVDDFASEAEADCRRLLTAPFIPHLTYFRNQFVDAAQGAANDTFDNLHFQDGDQKDLVSNALINLTEETPELVKALLIIVHRLRDNLFRGLKWRRCNKKQRDDLYHASKVLMKAVDMSRR